MNLTSSHSSARSFKIRSVFKTIFFLILAISIFTTSCLAASYDLKLYYDNTYTTANINSTKVISYDTSFQQIQLDILNYDPAIFQVGRHYTFDTVFGIELATAGLYTQTYQDAIDSLVTNGYTEEWYTHYIYGYECYFNDSTDNIFDLDPVSYYIDPNECVVYANDICYTDLTDRLIDTSVPNGLYIQIKVHFDFTVNTDILQFTFNWYPYPFLVDEYSGAVRVASEFDISDIVSYDTTTVGAINQVYVDLSSQLTGMESALTSSLTDLMEQQDRYWELLLGGYEFSDLDYGFGILYEILNLDTLSFYELEKIYSKVNTINTSVTNIKATSQAMLKLLNGTTTTFYDFIASNVDILHQDLIDIKNYLDNTENSSSLGSDVGGLSNELIQGVGQPDLDADVLPSITPDSGYNWFSETIVSFQFILPFVLLGAFGVFIRMVVGR